jgi:hypothetical protein
VKIGIGRQPRDLGPAGCIGQRAPCRRNAVATPESARSVLGRARKIATRLRQLLDSIDADLVYILLLSDVTNVLVNIAAWASSCAQGSDMSPHIDQALDAAPGRFVSLSASAASNGPVKGSAASMRRELEAANQSLNLRLANMSEEIETATATLAGLRKKPPQLRHSCKQLRPKTRP